jgi:hypothetical protein
VIIELERTLVDEFPATYAALGARVGVGVPSYLEDEKCPMSAVGIEHEDGWFGLVRRFATCVEPWCSRTGAYVRSQKQKFGELRIAIPSTSQVIRIAAREVRVTSVRICEQCGTPGTLARSPRGSWATLCRDCRHSVGSYFDQKAAIERFLRHVIGPWRPSELGMWGHLLADRIQHHANGDVMRE